MMERTKALKLRSWSEDPSVTIERPQKNDVICGRGRTAFLHEGNHALRLVVLQTLPKYREAGTRLEKTIIIRTIIQEVLESGGRFLKRHNMDSMTGNRGYYVAGFNDAREKVSHALRDAASDKVKCMIAMQKGTTYRTSLETSEAKKQVQQSTIISPSPTSTLVSQQLSYDQPQQERIYPTFIMKTELSNSTAEPPLPATMYHSPSQGSSVLDLYNELSLGELGEEDFEIDDRINFELCLDDLLFKAVDIGR
jgi:hypothetical protein